MKTKDEVKSTKELIDDAKVNAELAAIDAVV